MKFALCLLALVACAFALPSKYLQDQTNTEFSTKKHVDLLQLFKYINSPAYSKEYVKIAKTFTLEGNVDKYSPEAYEQFSYWLENGFLPRGEIFSIFNDVHRQQAEALFKMFYHAKNYETFYRTAVWARQHMNEGLFLYTFSVAIVHRPDTVDVTLPPIFEIYPQYFFDSATMQQAYEYKMTYYGDKTHRDTMDKTFTVYSNYSDHHMNIHPEQSMSYYLEDVGINSFYYYMSIMYPFWMSQEEFSSAHFNRGELFFTVHQQLVARYYLERLSHGVSGIQSFNWDLPFETGYTPMLTYPNGVSFPERPNFADLHEFLAKYGQQWTMDNEAYDFTHVNKFESRIRDAIDEGCVMTEDGKKIELYTPEGFNMLANMVEGNADTPNLRYYGNYSILARRLLGYAKQPLDNEHIVPSALEHPETTMRDPAFYILFKKIVLLLENFKMNLPAYNVKDLLYQGVKLQRVEVSPLVTFFDHHYSDITNGMFVTPEEFSEDPFRVQVHQYRLNHKAFEYKIFVTSDRQTSASVKIFLGPKHDEFGRTININENRLNFVLLDNFDYDLTSGINVIRRNSRDSPLYARDSTTYFELYQKVLGASNDRDMSMEDTVFGFPQRFMLPRGTQEGMTYQLYVIVYPHMQREQHEDDSPRMYQQLFSNVDDHRAYGFPLDRKIEHETFFMIPNAIFRDVVIYHHSKQSHLMNREDSHFDRTDFNVDDKIDMEYMKKRMMMEEDFDKFPKFNRFEDNLKFKHEGNDLKDLVDQEFPIEKTHMSYRDILNKNDDYFKMADFYKKHNYIDMMTNNYRKSMPFMTGYTGEHKDMSYNTMMSDLYNKKNYEDMMIKNYGKNMPFMTGYTGEHKDMSYNTKMGDLYNKKNYEDMMIKNYGKNMPFMTGYTGEHKDMSYNTKIGDLYNKKNYEDMMIKNYGKNMPFMTGYTGEHKDMSYNTKIGDLYNKKNYEDMMIKNYGKNMPFMNGYTGEQKDMSYNTKMGDLYSKKNYEDMMIKNYGKNMPFMTGYTGEHKDMSYNTKMGDLYNKKNYEDMMIKNYGKNMPFMTGYTGEHKDMSYNTKMGDFYNKKNYEDMMIKSYGKNMPFMTGYTGEHKDMSYNTKMGDFYNKKNHEDMMIKNYGKNMPFMTGYTGEHKDMSYNTKMGDFYNKKNFLDMPKTYDTDFYNTLYTHGQTEMKPKYYHDYEFMTPETSYLDHFKTMPETFQHGKKYFAGEKDINTPAYRIVMGY